jgi:creatinine amidohydrolase
MPGRPSVWLHELSWDEVDAHLAQDDVALVPIGATEQHGHFAPLLLDTGWAVSVAEEAAKRAGCLVAPPLHYGFARPHGLCRLHRVARGNADRGGDRHR